MKRYYLSLLMVLLTVSAFSQPDNDPVLMNINGKEITRIKFLEQYNYDSGKRMGNSIPLETYLQLFIDNQLKIQSACAAGMDTAPAFLSKQESLRRKASKSYFLNKANKPYNNSNDYIEGLHIYRHIPQNTPPVQANRIQQQMDSIYNAIVANPTVDFNFWVNKYSNDKDTFRICRLQMPEEFEKVIYNSNIGEVSRPFNSPQGIHIVKILAKNRDMTVLRPDAELITDKLKAELNYVPDNSALNELLKNGKTNRTLFHIDGTAYTGLDFAVFSENNPKHIKQQLNDYIRKCLYNCENNKLETKYPAFKFSLEQQKEQELLSEINRQIINQSQNDKELEKYFDANKKRYAYELPRYKGLVIHTKDKKTGKRIKKQLRKIPENQRMDFLQRTYNDPSPGTIIAEEGTFAVAQNDFVNKLIFKVGNYVPLQSHPYTTVVGRKVKGPENYNEIRETLVKDYHAYLDSSLLSQLRKKSKVEINQEVLKTVNNH